MTTLPKLQIPPQIEVFISVLIAFSVLPKSAMYVLLGTVKIKTPDKGHAKFEIEKVVVHEDYSAYPRNDIALVKVLLR